MGFKGLKIQNPKKKRRIILKSNTQNKDAQNDVPNNSKPAKLLQMAPIGR